jgi:hypothetical protein
MYMDYDTDEGDDIVELDQKPDDEDERLAAPFYRGEMQMWLAEHPYHNEHYFRRVWWPTAKKRIASFERERHRQQQRNR